MGDYTGCDEDFLIDCQVADEVIAGLIRGGPVVQLSDVEPLALPQTVAALDFEVTVGEVKEEILADIAPGDHIFHLALQLCHQDLSRLHLVDFILN